MTCDVKAYFSCNDVLTSFIVSGRGHRKIVFKSRDKPLFSISTSAVSRKRDFVDEFNATLQCNWCVWPMTVYHLRGREASLRHRWLVADACWECGCHWGSMGSAWVGHQCWGPVWPVVQSSMPIEEKNQVNSTGMVPGHGWEKVRKGTYYPLFHLLWPYELLQ